MRQALARGRFIALIALAFGALAFGALAAGCGGGDRTGPSGPAAGLTLADLAGSYTATELQYTSKADTDAVVDLVADGEFVPLVLGADGTFDAGPAGSGSAAVQGDQLELDFGPDHDHFYQFTLSAGTLTIRNDTDEHFDFDDDGIDDPARLLGVFVRDETE